MPTAEVSEIDLNVPKINAGNRRLVTTEDLRAVVLMGFILKKENSRNEETDP